MAWAVPFPTYFWKEKHFGGGGPMTPCKIQTVEGNHNLRHF